MSQPSTLPVLVASATQNDAEQLNGLLRGLGMRVRIAWGGDSRTLRKALRVSTPDIVLFVVDSPATKLSELLELRDNHAPDVPVIAVGKKLDKLDAGAVITQGARDLVSINSGMHLKAVIERELPVAQQSAQLRRYAEALQSHETRFTDLVSESGDAIAYIQDGIHAQANPAYLSMFGYQPSDDIMGIPVMDAFAGVSQGTLKQAIKSVVKSGDASKELELKGVGTNNKPFSVTVALAPDVLDGEKCIRLSARAATTHLSPELEEQLGEREREAAKLKASLADIRHRDPLTGVYHRGFFLAQLRKIKPSAKVTRALALITADQFEAVEASVGAYASGRIISSLVELINISVGNKEPVGRFDDDTFAVVLSRPSMQDVEKWAATLCKAISKKVFEAASGSTTMTCHIGLAEVQSLANPELLLEQAQEASETGRSKGGNCHVVYHPPAIDDDKGSSDASWVSRVTTALKNDGFQLAYQPIASLEDSDIELQDVLVQMQDENGSLIPAGKFMAAAKRQKLVPAIDRWVIKHLLPVVSDYCAKHPKARFFGRISTQFLMEAKPMSWFESALKHAPSRPPNSLIMQLPERFLDSNMKEAMHFIEILRKYKCAFAVAEFGLGRNSPGVLDHLRPDYVKLNDTLLADMDKNEDHQKKVAELVNKAKAKKTEIVAHRMESSDSIAILWQMGVQYVQGNYLQEAASVIQDSDVIAGAKQPLAQHS